ncbi:hypothetical protein Sgly_3161 [Syntrophobotulus glycolicus DSM 8271]|uniref:DUF6906 domain-containing protein n=1 Tax=Syntrophobotulus glycolicus (strain DSM 8271 / FlGlyR) TaxID=645991 RepID=F0SX58_SYNGF|nr:hypothetical protein [Syntrophobotulus glycolicus]ADY54884.1 hypothetical protein Sgly_0519 [Syntrophobotulus glycolicus DSM 8271]ADY56918.1 hypothetical protein Sgly_2639 [Syntrophobotulus glycolicus DSM 8271]ADY57255.1 hypothetical protein Sgly_2986 [Syntrophobotulus glycolicus DSM 8271]ADY57427.1 hypothetical protein Sgly_3161 [Syntrophobotulus glycolicus DSM 8271]
MKHGKRPTRAQKIRLKEAGLNYENWLVVKATTEGLEVVHKYSGKTRTIPATLGKQSGGERRKRNENNPSVPQRTERYGMA